MEGKDPILSLIMEKGPLEGQTLEFVPGSKIRIGRIIRGNTISIKDAGISSKHLGINFEVDLVRVGSWSISDLGSSNGTLLNSDKIQPFMSVKLSDGDVVDIGECTSIKVRVGVKVEVSKVRRNPPRRRGGKLGVVDENSELELGLKNENNDICRPSENSQVDNEKMKNHGRKVNLKRTRSRKNEKILVEKSGVENVEEIGIVECNKPVENLRPRKGRGAKKEETVAVCADCNQNGAEGMEGKQRQVESLKRITKSLRKDGKLDSLEESGLQSGKEMGNKNVRKGARGRRNLTAETLIESVEDETTKSVEIAEKLDSEVKENEQKGTRRRRNLMAETLIESVEDKTRKSVGIMENLDSEVNEIREVNEELLVKEVLEEEDGKVVDGMVGKEKVNSGVQGCGASAITSGVNNDNPYELDLEKMTIGAWLEYLEVNLLKQIFEDTEEMILGMRQKAKKFHELMLQQNKKTIEVPID